MPTPSNLNLYVHDRCFSCSCVNVRHGPIVDSALVCVSIHTRQPGHCVRERSPYHEAAVSKLVTLPCFGGECPSFTLFLNNIDSYKQLRTQNMSANLFV